MLTAIFITLFLATVFLSWAIAKAAKHLHERFNQMEARTNAIHMAVFGYAGNYNITLEGDGSIEAPYKVVVRKIEPTKTASDVE